MTPEQLRDIVQRIGIREAGRRAGCAQGALSRCCKGREAVPQSIAARLEPLIDFQPVTPREVQAIVGRFGGQAEVARSLNVSRAAVQSWLSGVARPSVEASQAMRQLWVDATPPVQSALGTRPLFPSPPPRSATYREFRREVLAPLEREYFAALDHESGGSISEMSRRCGLERGTVRAHLERLGLRTPRTASTRGRGPAAPKVPRRGVRCTDPGTSQGRPDLDCASGDGVRRSCG
jgi:transcriptional regulator with XRE-family HTH domain